MTPARLGLNVKIIGQRSRSNVKIAFSADHINEVKVTKVKVKDQLLGAQVKITKIKTTIKKEVRGKGHQGQV